MLGESRKVAIIGTSRDSLQLAPWDDPTWTFWAHSSAVNVIPEGTASVLIDTHPRECFTEGRKNGFEHYYKWLQKQTTPILMQDAYPDIPAAVKFPRVRVKQGFNPTPQNPLHFGSQAASMVALAIYLGAKQIGFWGVEYAEGSEYARQRAHTLLWIGMAMGKDIAITVPPNSRLLVNNDGDYGYESHDTEEKRTALKQEYLGARNKSFDPAKLLPVTPENQGAVRLLREEKQPEWKKAVAEFGPEDKIPLELLAMEERQREQYRRATGLSDVEGLPRGGAAPEGIAGTAGGTAAGWHAHDATDRGAQGQGDGLVQPGRDALSAGPDRPATVSARRVPKGRATVGRARRATRH
jgi:hypothetical protein